MKRFSAGAILLLIVLAAIALNGQAAVDAGERVALHAIDTVANQPYSVPDALERQMPAEAGNSRALKFALVMLITLVLSVLGLFALYLGTPFIKQARGLARDMGRRPAPPSRMPAARVLPALPPPDTAPALPASTPGEVEWF